MYLYERLSQTILKGGIYMPRKKKTEETISNENIEVVDAEDIKSEVEIVDNSEENVKEPNAEPEPADSVEEAVDENEKTPENVSRGKVIADKRKREKERAEANAEREKTLSSWEQLKNARHERRILNGTIIGVETLNGKINVAILLFGGFRIIVPFEEMYTNGAIDMSTVHSKDQRVRRELQMLQKLLGAEIPFIITEMTGSPAANSEYAIVASRRLAIKNIAARNFNIHKSTGTSRIQAHDIVESTVISVGPHAVFVNIAGIDKSISVFRLTYKYVTDCRDLYHPGDTINVYINNVKHNNDGEVVDIDVSAKIAERPAIAERMKKITEGMRCMGIITSVRQSFANPNKTVTMLYLEAFDVPATALYTQIDSVVKPLQTGDRVIFSVYSKSEEKCIVSGNIIQRI